MECKKINLEELQTQNPNNSEVEISKQPLNVQKEYMEFYNTYRKLFTEYMIDKLNLKEYDKKLAESELNFIPTKEPQMDIYQYFSSPELKYFYIRNNLYLEHLTKQEAEVIKRRSKEENLKLDEETKKLIENTYQKVITEEVPNVEGKYRVSFGPLNGKFFANSDSVVIGARYDTYEQAGQSDDEWFEQYCKREDYLQEMLEQVQEESKGKLKTEVTAFKYTDNSVIVKDQSKQREEQEEER